MFKEQDSHNGNGYQKQQQQQQLNQDSYGQSFNGVGFWKQPQQQQQQQNGWVDQQLASSSNIINGNNGWKNEGNMFATSYANQKIYH
ncbi:adult cuticle protein [Culex quinquefasciatus]|uniref:Adult cuticle protein n=1 Tax=Culex quinquefasciatus TaxID=7176 RepID=B0W883_CULQU|nr:adult cuticle protein [Culex quinquefasciatus]|eukprot:XP_001844917.1 adult cuticle protein [Culex quinquefasciatus]